MVAELTTGGKPAYSAYRFMFMVLFLYVMVLLWLCHKCPEGSKIGSYKSQTRLFFHAAELLRRKANWMWISIDAAGICHSFYLATQNLINTVTLKLFGGCSL